MSSGRVTAGLLGEAMDGLRQSAWLNVAM